MKIERSHYIAILSKSEKDLEVVSSLLKRTENDSKMFGIISSVGRF